MDRSAPRYEESRLLGEALARFFCLEEEETRLLLEVIRLHQRSNAEPPGPESRHREYSQECQEKVIQLTERSLNAYLEFSRLDGLFWEITPPENDTSVCGDIKIIPLDLGELLVSDLPDGCLALTCRAPTLLDGSITLVLPSEYSVGIQQFRLSDPRSFKSEYARIGTVLRHLANALFMQLVLTVSRPSDARKVREHLLAALKDLNARMRAICESPHPALVNKLHQDPKGKRRPRN